MAEKVVHIPKVGEITLKKNPRSRRLKLYVKPDRRVIVSLPYLASFKSAEEFAVKNTAWILEQQSKLDSGLTKFTLNSVFYTKNHLIKITEKNRQTETVKKDGNVVTVLIPEGTDMESDKIQLYINKVITEVYRKEATSYLPGRVEQLASAHKFRYNNVTIRNNKTNWGSCSYQNNISLNLNLMKLPDNLIDYIILHELAHTQVKNHSADFYRLLDSVTEGKARELAKEVKLYSSYTY